MFYLAISLLLKWYFNFLCVCVSIVSSGMVYFLKIAKIGRKIPFTILFFSSWRISTL